MGIRGHVSRAWRACSRLPGYARQGRVLVVVGVPPAGCHRHFELTHLHTWNWELQRRRARSVCYIVVGRRQGFESEPSALPSEACSSVGQSLSVPSTSVDDSRFPNPESSAVTAFLHSRNDSVISNRSRSPADQPSEEFALRRRRVCVIAGLRVSGMPASTGRREQSVCFFAGKRGPASECRVSRAGAGRAAARQNRGAHLEARGADSLLVLRHSQRPGGDARRHLLRCRWRSQKFRRGGREGTTNTAYDDDADLCTCY